VLHWALNQLSYVDPMLAAIFFATNILWAIIGFEICRATHKQRGIEVDRPVTDGLPVPPPPVVVPDHVPDDWPTSVHR
jgi:hypothetical protein